ncbi:MAG: diguanylate cyclase [Burkholderiaceae bacterium]
MSRLSPVLVIASGLAMLACAVMLMGDFFFSYMPDRQSELAGVRRRVADIVSVPAIDMLSRGELERASETLDRFVRQDSDILSIGIRRQDGRMLLSTAEHRNHWPSGIDLELSPNHAVVPIRTPEKAWGSIEVAFAEQPDGILAFLSRHPALAAALTMLVFGTGTFALYMRRVLHQFDPKTAIPDRVRAAFDAMAEAVVITDDQGRIALANERFHGIAHQPDDALMARPLSKVNWIANAMPGNEIDHPWTRSMRELQEIKGIELSVDTVDDQPLLLIVNCAPIVDARQRARGCMVTFDDVTALHRANRRLEYTLRQLQDSRREVEHKAADLERLASVDYLTGVLNRRAFTTQADQAFADAIRDGAPFAAMMIDIDHFKRINDSFGHAVGDQVIKAVAETLMKCTRDGDLVGRYGGEEFCVALPNTSVAAATTIGQRIRETIEQTVAPSLPEVKGLKVTTSVGVAIYDRRFETLHALVSAADEALYDAKESGRNRVRVAPSEEEAAETARKAEADKAASDEAPQAHAEIAAQPVDAGPDPHA